MMKKVFFTILVALMVLPAFASAQLTIPGVTGGTSGSPSGPPSVNVMEVLDRIVNWLFAILLIVAVIFLIVAAFYFVTAMGDDAKVSKARMMVLWALVGVLVALVSKGLVGLVQTIVGSSSGL